MYLCIVDNNSGDNNNNNTIIKIRIGNLGFNEEKK